MSQGGQAQLLAKARKAADREPASGIPEPELGRASRHFDRRAGAVVLVGGLVTGALIAAVLAASVPAPLDLTLQQVATADIEAASQSLVAGSAAALVQDAKSCRRPLAFLLVRSTSTAGGRVRFRSGSYLSPFLKVGPGVERLALPFPAPYEVGRGQIFIDNEAGGAEIFLTPGFKIGPGPTTAIADVHWNPKAPC